MTDHDLILIKESFKKRAVNMWNFLPEYVVNAHSVDSFNNRLDKQWNKEEIVYVEHHPYIGGELDLVM